MTSTTKSKYLLNAPKYHAGEGRPVLLRMEFAPTYTKVDFGYQATAYYRKGGWVKISKDTFIRIHASGEVLRLLRAEHIPVAPTQHFFKTSKDWLYYSLYFPPMPMKKGFLDLVEVDPGEDTDFNYMDIFLDPKKLIELR